MNRHEEIETWNMDGMSFAIYSSDDIRALSVKQIKNPNSFDQLNHPTNEGLYDPVLGK